jgi:hypothetical protein
MMYPTNVQNLNYKYFIFQATQIDKVWFFWRFEWLYSDSHIYYFCIAQNTNYFQLEICMFVEYIISYVTIFFLTHKYVFF